MHPTRLLARPMLAAVFVASGADVLRNPGPRVAKAEPVAKELAARLGLPEDTAMLVRVNAATQVVAGTLLSMGRLRRLSALALIASLIPTTYAGHRFWEADDPRERAEQRVHFLKNLAVLGGLVLEAVDAEGRPSLGWRSRRTARTAAAAGGVTRMSRKGLKGAAALKGADTVIDAVAGGLGQGAAETASRAKSVADSALSAKAVSDLASASRGLVDGVVGAKVVKDLTGRLAEQDFDLEAARQMGARVARTKAATAALERISR